MMDRGKILEQIMRLLQTMPDSEDDGMLGGENSDMKPAELGEEPKEASVGMLKIEAEPMDNEEEKVM